MYHWNYRCLFLKSLLKCKVLFNSQRFTFLYSLTKFPINLTEYSFFVVQLITLPFYYANKTIQVVTHFEITVTNYTLFSKATIKWNKLDIDIRKICNLREWYGIRNRCYHKLQSNNLRVKSCWRLCHLQCISFSLTQQESGLNILNIVHHTWIRHD